MKTSTGSAAGDGDRRVWGGAKPPAGDAAEGLAEVQDFHVAPTPPRRTSCRRCESRYGPHAAASASILVVSGYANRKSCTGNVRRVWRWEWSGVGVEILLLA